MSEAISVNFKSGIFRLQHLKGIHYIEIPVKIMKPYYGKRLICELNKTLSFQCGIVSLHDGKGYISVNAKRLKELGLAYGDTVKVKLELDESEYGMEMPAELAELLKQDKEGNKRFQKLPAAKQRYILFYISLLKNTQKRIDRAITLIENLKNTIPGKESFAELLKK